MTYRNMTADDFNEVSAFWKSVPEIELNEADEMNGFCSYLAKNEGQSFVCVADNRIVGTIICGNDGRYAFIYHLAVAPEFRQRGIGAELVRLAQAKQEAIKVAKLVLFIKIDNDEGKRFWCKLGFNPVQDADVMAMDL